MDLSPLNNSALATSPSLPTIHESSRIPHKFQTIPQLYQNHKTITHFQSDAINSRLNSISGITSQVKSIFRSSRYVAAIPCRAQQIESKRHWKRHAHTSNMNYLQIQMRIRNRFNSIYDM